MKRDKPLEFHPYAALFPMMDDDALAALAEDIRDNGLRFSVVVDADDRVVDGRNRLVACRMAGVEPRIEALDLDEREVLTFVASSNIHRRHLTPSQRASIAAKIANTKPGNPDGSNQHVRKPARVPVSSEPVVTQAQAADLLAVSERSVRAAARVQKQGTPELQQAVDDGSVSVREASRIADLPKDQQADAVASATATKPRKASNRQPRTEAEFDAEAAAGELNQMLRKELDKWPGEALPTAAHWIRALLTELKL